MRAAGIAGYRKRRRVRTTIPEQTDQKVPDLLKRDFTAAAPNRRYVGDITYLPLADGQNLYLATVLDCYSRRLVGWAIADHMRTELVEDALTAAAATRGGSDGLAGAIFHSDHRPFTRRRTTRTSARGWASADPWVPSAPAPTTRSRSRSTPPSSARSSKTPPAGATNLPAADRSSDG